MNLSFHQNNQSRTPTYLWPTTQQYFYDTSVTLRLLESLVPAAPDFMRLDGYPLLCVEMEVPFHRRLSRLFTGYIYFGNASSRELLLGRFEHL